MDYDFSTLSPADFEDLVGDLVGIVLGVRFEAFAAGPDGGVDGRHASADTTIILQAKHYVRSTYAALKSQMKRERRLIDELCCPARYVLATSCPLTPGNKRELASIIGPTLQSEADILGREDLNALLKSHPRVEQTHIRLWLASTVVLERVLRSDAHAVSVFAKDDIEKKVKVYAPNPSLVRARDILESQHILLISGPPGIGKTTLAEMLAYAYMAKDWELVFIRSLEDGLASMTSCRAQIFLFDDFLGQVALDQRSVARSDSGLTRFMHEIRNSSNARFILTTRSYIFEEACLVSEHLSDPALQLSKYVLDLEVYSRQIRARILYNHLYISDLTNEYISALVESGKIGRIVDHPHFSPRIVEWMTRAVYVCVDPPDQYADLFLRTLNHPDRIWDVAFRRHIPRMCQHLLVSLYFCDFNAFGITLGELRLAFEGLHENLCARYGESRSAKDFEEAVRILDGSFIRVWANTQPDFINPSVRDYLKRYVDDPHLLEMIAMDVRDTRSARRLWIELRCIYRDDRDARRLALLFLGAAETFARLPVWLAIPRGGLALAGLSNVQRIQLLIEWWHFTAERRFLEIAKEIARSPVDGLRMEYDAEDAIEMFGRLRHGSYDHDPPCAKEIADGLETAIAEMIDGWDLWEWDLTKLARKLERWHDYVGPPVIDAMRRLLACEIENAGGGSPHEVKVGWTHGKADILPALARQFGILTESIDRLVENLSNQTPERRRADEASSFSQPQPLDTPSFQLTDEITVDLIDDSDQGVFDDLALKNLFETLPQPMIKENESNKR